MKSIQTTIYSSDYRFNKLTSKYNPKISAWEAPIKLSLGVMKLLFANERGSFKKKIYLLLFFLWVVGVGLCLFWFGKSGGVFVLRRSRRVYCWFLMDR